MEAAEKLDNTYRDQFEKEKLLLMIYTQLMLKEFKIQLKTNIAQQIWNQL
jgi:hypothetical protein